MTLVRVQAGERTETDIQGHYPLPEEFMGGLEIIQGWALTHDPRAAGGVVYGDLLVPPGPIGKFRRSSTGCSHPSN